MATNETRGTPATTIIAAGLSDAAVDALRASVQRAGAPATVTVATADAESIAAAIDEIASPLVSIVTRALTLAPEVFARVSTHFAEHPSVDVLYTDEARRLTDGSLLNVLKPDPAAERLRNQYFWGDLVVFRTEAIRRIGGVRSGYAGATLYDLALRATRGGLQVAHLPVAVAVVDDEAPLGGLDPSSVDPARRALEEHLAATGGGRVRAIGLDGVHDTVRPVQGEPLISIVIPTRGQYLPGTTRSYLVDAIESVVERTSYEAYEFVVVIDDVADQGVVDRIRELAGDRLHLVPWAESFNFSGKVNLGVLNALGEYVLILNDDVRVLTPDWLQSMLALAQLPNAGMSGCMLYYEDDTIQHAGHHYWRGDTIHIGMNVPRGTPGPTDGYRVEREVVGITAACAMMRRSVYLEVGGMTTLLPGAFNDVDLCLKVLGRGYDILWTPHAELYHYESKTRDARVRHYEVKTAWGRWEHRLHQPGYWPYPV